MARALTAKGRKQAARMAAWLKSRLPEGCRILVSPALRAVQTADALGLAYELTEKIAPGADATALLAAAGWPDAGMPVLLIGHQPTLGRVCGLLLCGQETEVSIKKGGVFWLSHRVRDNCPQTVVKAVMTPDLV